MFGGLKGRNLKKYQTFLALFARVRAGRDLSGEQLSLLKGFLWMVSWGLNHCHRLWELVKFPSSFFTLPVRMWWKWPHCSIHDDTKLEQWLSIRTNVKYWAGPSLQIKQTHSNTVVPFSALRAVIQPGFWWGWDTELRSCNWTLWPLLHCKRAATQSFQNKAQCSVTAPLLSAKLPSCCVFTRPLSQD